MKRLLFFTLVLFLVAFAWSDTFTIGTGTSSTSNSPFHGLYDFGWNKIIYTAAEINTAGLSGPSNIYGLGFYAYNTPANYVMLDQKVYVRHTTLVNYGTATDETGTGYPAAAGFTQVFNADVVYNGLGWYYIMFNSPFAWDGTSNLEIFWENWDGDYYSGYPTHTYTATGTNYMTVYKYANTTFPTTVGTRTYNRPNLRLVTQTLDGAPTATLVFPANAGLALSDAVLTWNNAQGMASSYDVYFGTSSNPPYLANTADMVYAPTLSAGATYYWKVVARNANGAGTASPIWSFTTPGANQLAESFENTTFPPTGWANPGTWSRSTTTPVYHGTGTAYKSASTTPAILSTPILAINGSSTLDFWYRTSSTTGYGLLNIKYSTDRVTWSQIGATISMPTTTEWRHATVALGAIPAGNYYLGFEVLTSTSTSSIYIDYVFGPNLAAVAPGPVTLSAPADAATGISNKPTFTWTAPTTGGVPTGYKVYCDTNADPTTQIADVTALTYTATAALPYSTLLYWKVVAYNAAGNSTGNTVRSFTTIPDPTIYTLPWLEDFGTTGTTFPPANWTRWSGALANPSTLTSGSTVWGQDNWVNDTTADPVNWSARMNIYSTARQHWIITPPIQIPGAGYQLEFDIALTDYASTSPITADPNGTTGVDDKFIVLIGDGSSWTPANILRQYDNAGSPYVYNNIPNTGEHLTFPLDAYTGIKYIAFYGESTVSNADNDFFVDNVKIRQTPAGAPEHVTLVSPADGSTGMVPENLNLAWTPSLTGGTPAYYEVYVGENPIDPGSDYYGEYFYETTNGTLNLSAQTDIDLAYNSTWYWAVLPYNSEGLSPDAESPEFMVWDFTIIADPTIVALPHEEYFDSVTAPALPYGWTGYVNATVTTAYVNTYSSTTYAVSAPNSARLYNSTDAAANLMLITPEIDLPINTIKARFYARGSTAGQVLLVGTVNMADNTFTAMGSIATTAVQAQYQVSFADYAGTDTRIAFKHGLGATSRTIYIDNVELLELLANDLSATTLTGTNYLQAGVAADYVVTVFNEGTTDQNSYTVNLKTGATTLATLAVTTPLAAGASAQHTLNWTPATGGVYPIFGEVVLAGDQYAGNNVTATKEVYVVDASMTLIPVGDDATTTSGYYVPISMYYKNGVTEELYFTDEMHLQSGSITALVYKNTFVTNLMDKPIKIWMAHTAVTDLSGGWLPAVDYTLVYDGTVDFPSGVNYIVIPLQTPFAYTGGTLATRVYRPMDTAYYSTSDKFYYTTNPAHTVRSRYLHADATTYDPLAPSAAGTTLGYFPNTTFVVQNAVLQTQAILNGYVYEAGTTNPIEGATVTVTDERYTTTTDETGFYEIGFWENHTVNVYASAIDYYNSSTVSNIALTLGNTVSQNLTLQPLPNLTVSGVVTSNDYPAGLEGATVELFGYHNYSTITGVGGVFSIADVKGNSAGSAYTWEVSKEGYESEIGSFNAIGANVNLGTINLNEFLWPAYTLTASHEGANARLAWEPAGAPDYYFTDFETDNGGWVGSGYGDWQWTDTYNVANYVVGGYPASEVPPTIAHSGDGLWGTVLYGPYAMSGAWSYLTQTFDLAGYVNPQLSFWRWNNLYYTYDYYYVQVSTNGTDWTTVLSETAINNVWAEKVVDLSAYADQTIQIRFAMYATTVVSYAGLYIDDIYIGPATTRHQTAQFGERNDDRWFLNYSVYRRNPGASWILLNDAITDVTYLDTDFASQPEGQYQWGVSANYSGSLQSELVLSNILGIFITPPATTEGTIGATGGNVSITWPVEPGATYYTIYGSNDPYTPDPWTVLGYSATPSFNFSAATTPYKFFKVTASDGVMPSGRKMQ